MPSFTQYQSNTADTTSGPSEQIWADFPTNSIAHDPGLGYHYWNDMEEYVADNGWVLTSVGTTDATVTEAEDVGSIGVWRMDSTGTAADGGGELQRLCTCVEPAADRTIYYETRLNWDETDQAQFFAGLTEIDLTMFVAGANTSTNHLGFEMNALTQAGTVGTASTANFYGEKAGTRNTAAAGVGLDVHTFVANTYVKLGFKVLGVTECRVYVNGVWTDTIPTANIPIVNLTPCYVFKSEDGSDPILDVDWLRVGMVGRYDS